MTDVSLGVADGVATIVLDRPPVNALTRDTYSRIGAAFEQAGRQRDVHAVVFTAAGRRAFSAGVDLKAYDAAQRATEEPEVALDRGKPIRDLLNAIGGCPVPVICAMNGVAIGAGAGMVSMCDIIVAAEGSKLGFTEINVGLLGGLAHLEMLVGRYRSRAMYFTGELLDAQELRNIGVVHRVVAADRLQEEARQLALDIARRSPIAVRLAKQAMVRIEALPLMEAYRIEQDYTQRLQHFEDAQEARRALQEKRPPQWKWR